MIRTHIIHCNLKKEVADILNLESGHIYTQVMITHWRVFRHSGHWLSHYGATQLNDWYNRDVPKKLFSHSIDAAQEGFYKACKTAKAIKKIDPSTKYPHWTKKFRTTIWKSASIKNQDNKLILSNGRGNEKIIISLPNELQSVLRFLEVRLVYDKRARRYVWHIVTENGKQSQLASGTNIISVDLGEIHPAVVSDEHEANIITCRKRRHAVQGHAKRLASLAKSLSRKKKGSIRHKKLIRTKIRMKAKHECVMRDMEHKISRAIVNVAIERQANTIVMGDVRDIADGVNLSKQTNQKISTWNHGKIRKFTEYKADAVGIKVVLQDERYSSQTCPNCQERHKPKGRNYKCPTCQFQSHRDVVGAINILSIYKWGEPGNIPAPTQIKHRIPLWVMRRCPDMGLAA